MKSSASTESIIYDFKHHLLLAALQDDDFRKRIVRNGAVSVADLTLPKNLKQQLPRGLEILVHADTNRCMHLVIPTILDDSGPDGSRQVIRRAMEDTVFLQALKSRPRQTLEEALGIELPDNRSFKVLEETKLQKHLVIPIDERLGARGFGSAGEVYAARGWCGKTLKTVIINLCPTDTRDMTDPRCQIRVTNDVTDPKCAPQTCTPTFTHGM